MKITILAVGKIKEKFFTDSVGEYSRRLSRYCSLEIREVADEATPDKASPAMQALILEREGERLIRVLDRFPGACVIALAIDGKGYDSIGFSDYLSRLQVQGCSHLVFVIGGSLGLSMRVLDRAHERVSFSRMTFPHQLMRVILLEQVYRAMRIAHGEPYHK